MNSILFAGWPYVLWSCAIWGTILSGAGDIIPLLLPLLCVDVPLSYSLIEKPAMQYGRYLSR